MGGRHSKEKSPTLLIRTCGRNYQMTPSERGVLYTQRQDFSPSPKARATALHNIHSRLKKKKCVQVPNVFFINRYESWLCITNGGKAFFSHSAFERRRIAPQVHVSPQKSLSKKVVQYLRSLGCTAPVCLLSSQNEGSLEKQEWDTQKKPPTTTKKKWKRVEHRVRVSRPSHHRD